MLLSSFPTEEDEEDVVLLAELCLRLRLTSSVLLSLDKELEADVDEAFSDEAVEDVWGFPLVGADDPVDLTRFLKTLLPFDEIF